MPSNQILRRLMVPISPISAIKSDFPPLDGSDFTDKCHHILRRLMVPISRISAIKSDSLQLDGSDLTD
ncbi:hypothetical protein [Metabacillus indicus]|uniref:hypothetical protein n=1 Tax=Metabacillus indicus TaxID=246786 RepID=UPI001300C4A1|nr:hypothetical protein [Metabacillus indicus]